MYKIDQDLKSKYWYVFPASYSENNKWAVGFESAYDAESYKSALMSGKVASPYDAPQSYGQTGKYYNEKMKVYTFKKPDYTYAAKTTKFKK